MKNLTPAQVQEALKSGTAMLVDVREPEEYEAEHIAGAISMPVSAFDAAAVVRKAGKRDVIFMCRSGKRAAGIHGLFTAETGQEAACLEGSIIGWKEAGLPVKAGSGG